MTGPEAIALRAALRAVCGSGGEPATGFDVPASEPAPWIPRVRRYSFEGALS